jgi:hypothetical protein
VNTISSGAGIAVYVPESAVRDGHIWICNPDTKRAEKRTVTTSIVKEGMIRVDSGIRPNEWIIIKPDGINVGQRLKPQFNQGS